MRASDVVIILNNVLLYVAVIIIIVVEVVAIRKWTSSVQEFVIDNEVTTLELRARAAADLASVKFLDMKSDVSLVRHITQHFANGSLAATSTFSAQNYFNAASYTGVSTSDYKYHSGWYNHRTGDNSASTLNSELDTTALFRHPWESVSGNWLAQGFGRAGGMTRFFPLGYNSGFPTKSYLCVSNDARNNTLVTGYDPTCRKWYAEAETNTDAIIYSSPYEDALSGGWVITLSTAVMKVVGATSTLYGCLFSDVSMIALEKFLTDLEGTHTFLIDTSGNLVAHKVFENGASLQQRLYPDDEREQYKFRIDQLATMTSGATSGRLSYVYRGIHFIGGFAKVNGTDYICGIFASVEPVVEKVEQIETNGENWIFIIAYCVVYFAAYTFGMGGLCLGERIKSHFMGFCAVGVPLALLFVSLLAVALPLSFVANAGVVSDTEDLLAEQTSETVRQLSINNGDWLAVYLQSAWYRNLQSLFHLTTRLSTASSEIQFGASFQDDTVNSALLSQPLVSNPRLPNSTNPVSLGDSSWFVTGTSAAAAATLSSSIKDQINSTQLLNQFYRSLYTTNPDFVLTYAGFSSQLFRKYPGDVSSDLTYDPTQRSWYSLAQSDSAKSLTDSAKAANSVDYGYKGTIYTPAYKDAFSGEWMLTAARATADSSAVLAGDLLLATITDIFSNIKFFRTGRVTLFDFEDNLVIADRDLMLSSSRSSPYSYTDMATPPVSTALFNQIKQGGTVGPMITTGSDGVDYYIYSRKLNDTNLNRYGIMTSVPVAEAREAVEPTLDKIKAQSLGVGLVLGLGCFLAIIFILVSSTLAVNPLEVNPIPWPAHAPAEPEPPRRPPEHDWRPPSDAVDEQSPHRSAWAE